jgi:hypothetical protein
LRARSGRDFGDHQESGDLYGKVVGVTGEAAARVTGIRLTSVDPADQLLLEKLLSS